MAKEYIVIDAHAEEYGIEDCHTMTVGELVSHLKQYDPDMKIILGYDMQSSKHNNHYWWWTLGNITSDRIYVIPEDTDDEEDEDDESYADVYPKKISLDNGHSYLTPHEVIEKLNDPECVITWEQITNRMRDLEMIEVNSEYAPCSNEDFLKHYLDIAPWDIVIG